MRRITVLISALALLGSLAVAASDSPTVTFQPASASAGVPAHGPGIPDPTRIDPSVLTDPQSVAGPEIDELRGKDRIVVNGRGVGKDADPDPMKFSVTVPLYSYDTGQQIGSVTHSFQCANPSCMILNDVDVYRLGDGDITAPGTVSVVHDPQHPGFVLTAARSGADNITAATGAYAGRTGRVQVYGYVDARGFPAQFILDEVYVFELD